MMKIGSSFKHVRKDKNMTQKEVARDILSVAQLSKFENNKTEISASKLFQLLDRVNVSLTEFQIIYLNDDLYNQSVIIDEIAEAYYQKNLFRLQSLNQKQLELYETFGNSRFYHNQIWIQQCIRHIQDLTFDKNEMDKIFFYLMNVENWGSYEITLFNNLSFAFTLNQLKHLSKTATKKIYIYSEKGVFSDLHHLTATLIGNLASIFIDHDELDFANELLIETNNLLKNTDFLNEKIHQQFRLGIYWIKKRNYDKGKKLAQKSIQQLTEFELFDMAQYFQTQLDRYLR